MNGSSPEGWGRGALRALVLILLIAFGAHWAYELLMPIVPLAFALVVLFIVGTIVFRRRR